LSKWNRKDLFDYEFNDKTTLIWSTDKQSFVYLNQLASWILSCLQDSYSASIIVQLLVEEQSLKKSDAEELVQSLSDPDAVFNSGRQTSHQSVTDSLAFPFVECAGTDISRTKPLVNLPLVLGGVNILVNIYSESIVTKRVTRTFDHLISADNQGETVYSIDVGKSADGQLWVTCDATGAFYANDEDELTTLVYWMLFKTVESSRDWLVALHAGGVLVGGKVVMLSGPGGSGKSTLTVALAHKYQTYLSDELVVVSRRNHLAWSVPTAPCLKEGSWSAAEKFWPNLDIIEPMNRLDRYVKFLPMSRNISLPKNATADGAILIFPTFNETSRSIIETLTNGEAIDLLLDSGCLIGKFRDRSDFCDFARWVDGLRCYKMQFNSTEQGLRLIDDALKKAKASV